MSIETYQGVVKNGQIELLIKVELPENSEVFVIVPKNEKPKFDLAEMAKQMPEDYQASEEDFGKPVGKEIW